MNASNRGGGNVAQDSLQQQARVQFVDVPVLDVRQAEWVELGTGLAVLIGCGWVVWCLVSVLMRDRTDGRNSSKKRD